MSFDPEKTISRLQSDTVKSALKGLILNGVSLLTVATGKTFDIGFIQMLVDNGLPIAINGLSMYFYFKAYRGRVEADTKIEPLPWRNEIQSMKEK